MEEGSDLGSFCVAPPLESKLILDTGSISTPSKDYIGEYKSIPLNGSISSGVRKYQSNRFFWNHDFFTFSYKNCSIGIILSCYHKLFQKMYTVIYPIFLPRVCLSLMQKVEEEVNPSVKLNLLKQVVFYLNIGWTCYGNFTKTGSFSFLPQSMYGTPQFYAFDGKGNFSEVGSEIVNEFMPVIGEGFNTQPPLVWDIASSNMQLCLRWNPLSEGNEYQENVELGWGVISLRDFMSKANIISFRDLGEKPVHYFIGNNSIHSYSMVSGPNTGWCGEGGYHLGFGYESNSMKGNFEDGYTDEERYSLFQKTNLPVLSSPVPPTTIQEFFRFCSTYRLVTKPGGVYMGVRIASLLPSRFYIVESNALSRQAQRSIVSNNPVFRQSTITIFYNTIFSSKTWKDETSKSNGVSTSDNAVNHFNPMHSIQSVDITVKDEWGNIIHSFNDLNYPIHEEGGFYSDTSAFQNEGNSIFINNNVVEGDGCKGGAVPIADYPTWLGDWVPNSSTMTNWECILGNNQWNCNWVPFLLYNPLSSKSVFPGSKSFNPQASLGCNIIHLGRLLGY